jgi:glycosyltransferase involved in cell wall biosynthesis
MSASAAPRRGPLDFVWLTRETPLIPTAGAYAYSNGLVRGLLATGARGRMVTYDRPGHPPGEAEGLELSLGPPPRRPRALSLLGSLPADSYRLASADFVRRMRAALTPATDAVIIDFYPMGWVLPHLRALGVGPDGRRPVLVYVSHQHEQSLRLQVARDHVGSPIMGAVLRLDAWKAGRLERRLIAAADIVTAIIEDDRRRFRAEAPGKTVITLNPGFDEPKAPPAPIMADRPRRVVLSGRLEWIAKKRNFRRFLDAAEAPFRAAGIEILVVGGADPAFQAEIEARSRICRFTGEVPDIAPYMAQGRIGVMPDEVGGGFKLKVLDYAFGGLPIAAIRSQIADLPLDLDRDAITRDNVADLAAAIVEAIDDVPRLDALQQKAFAACHGRFDWADRGRRLAEAIWSVRGM